MPSSHARARPRAAPLALLLLLLLVFAAGLLLLPPDGAIAGCERDGHFQRAGQLSCGILSSNAPYGPLLPLSIAALLPLVGTPYMAGRLLSLLCLLVVVGGSWRAARDLGAGTWLAALVALAVGFNGPMLSYGTQVCSDMPATAAFLLAGLAAWRCLEERRVAWAALAGVALAGACLVRVQYYLALPPLLVLLPLLAAPGHRGRSLLAAALGFVVPIALALALGLGRWGTLEGTLEHHLGLAAYTRNLVRAGALLRVGEGAAPVGIGARLVWSLRLLVWDTGGLPLLGGLGALWLAIRRPRWRPLLVALLPGLVLYLGLAWSHPPPDWGARRFYLFVVPPCVLGTTLLGRALLDRWLRIRALAVGVWSLVVLAVAAHGLWELVRFRPSALAWLEPAGLAPEQRPAAAYEREVFDRVGQIAEDLPACALVATNYHPAAAQFRNAWFLGAADLHGSTDWVEGLPMSADTPAWLVAVEPGGAPQLYRIERAAGGAPWLREGP